MHKFKIMAVATLLILVALSSYFLALALNPPKTTQFIVITATPDSSETLHYDALVSQVAPVEGTQVEVTWGDLGQWLIAAGAIDLNKFEDLYGGFTIEQKDILHGDHLDHITFTSDNIQFWTNILWAFGLTQQSTVLGEGLMQQNVVEVPLGNYASTAGWTLGSKAALELYNSTNLVSLTADQQMLIYRVAETIFRPCCGNHTAYPDCNHGMAVLGLLELLASQGATETELYEAAFAFNRYAFTNTYLNAAAYLNAEGLPWAEMDVRQLLGAEFSSGQGAQWVAAQVGTIPGIPRQGGSCSTS